MKFKTEEVIIQVNEITFLLDTFKDIKAELEQLIYDKEWYVTDVLDRVESSIEILTRKRKVINNDDD